MKRKLSAMLLAVMLLAACGSSDTPEFTQEGLQETLAAEWRAYSKDKPNFGGGLAMQILSPKGEYFLSTGMGQAMTNAHHFRTASCTKTFTAAAIMLLQQSGKLNVEDRIVDNIPGTDTPYVPTTADFNIPNKDRITIRMLLMHRAGVFDVTNDDLPDIVTVPEEYRNRNYAGVVLEQDPNHQFTFDELIGVDAAYRLSYPFVPGSEYHYSNTGYSILGKIVERVSGMTYGDFVKTELMVPNGLLSSSLPADALDQGLPLPSVDGFIWNGGELQNVTISNMSLNVAEGNVITTPRDLVRWCSRLLRGEAGLNQTTVEMMKIGMPSDGGGTYGLGISHSPQFGYGHTGAHAGYLTLMFSRPEGDVTFVLFSNVWDFSDGKTSLGNQSAAMSAAANKVLAQMGY